jgi:hypothetical protein
MRRAKLLPPLIFSFVLTLVTVSFAQQTLKIAIVMRKSRPISRKWTTPSGPWRTG